MTQIQRILRPKTLPIRSIKLRPVNELTCNHHLECKCEMCGLYEHKKVTKIMKTQERETQLKVQEKLESDPNSSVRDFQWIISHLMMPQKRLITRSLDVFIPEIVFFRDGEPSTLYCTKQIEDATIKTISRGKIHATVIQKIFNDRRRKYKDFLKNNHQKRTIQEKVSSVGAKTQVKRDQKNIIAIRYNNGCQSMGTQKDLGDTLLKKKQGKDVSFIKNQKEFLGPTEVVMGQYKIGHHLYEQLFERARKIIKIYSEVIHEGEKEYISEAQEHKFCSEVLKKSSKIYAQYTLYKIIHFIYCFYDVEIEKIWVKFIINEKNQIFLDQVFELERKQLFKFDWNNQTYKKKVKEEEYRIFFAKEIQPTRQVQEKAKVIEENMCNIYEKMKDHYGLSVQEEDNKQQKLNNQFFSNLHPNFKLEVSQVLKDPQMTVNRFKREHLGYKPAKKPIVTPFNSDMVTTLHKLTPVLKQANPHQYIPKRSSSSHLSSRKRSFSRTQYSSNVNYTQRQF